MFFYQECLNPFYSGGICRTNLTPLNEVSVDKYSMITSQVESKKVRVYKRLLYFPVYVYVLYNYIIRILFIPNYIGYFNH